MNEPYYIFHHMAGQLKGTVEAASEREALALRFGVPDEAVKTSDGGRATLTYGLRGADVVCHRYTAQSVAARDAGVKP